MSGETDNQTPNRSTTWFQKGLDTIARAGRPGSIASQRSANPLREVFTDLMAYVIFFDKTCAQQPPTVNEFREKVLALVKTQEEHAKNLGISTEIFREARFPVLSWVDEMILNSAWPHRAQWHHLMLTYYNTNNAGEEFFRRLENLPSQATDIREIYYLCLGLGFEGKYAFGDSRHELKELRQGLYRQLCSANGDIRQNYPQLFPEAYQRATAAAPRPSGIKPIWYIAACCVPVILFVCFWLLLRNETNRLLAMIEAPPAPSRPPEKEWGRSLVEELRAKKFRAVDEPDGVRITLESLLFRVNSAELSPEAKGRIDIIVETVRRYAPERVIVVEGHASREPGGDEARNQKLSAARASTVVETFVGSGFRRDRLSAHGFGSEKPVALNETEQGRQQNRRVEIFIKK
jgi:type VI secretion system protein ImpK